MRGFRAIPLELKTDVGKNPDLKIQTEVIYSFGCPSLKCFANNTEFSKQILSAYDQSYLKNH
jgi:hypothetical protein